jgi:hypothetical protein
VWWTPPEFQAYVLLALHGGQLRRNSALGLPQFIGPSPVSSEDPPKAYLNDRSIIQSTSDNQVSSLGKEEQAAFSGINPEDRVQVALNERFALNATIQAVAGRKSLHTRRHFDLNPSLMAMIIPYKRGRWSACPIMQGHKLGSAFPAAVNRIVGRARRMGLLIRNY